MSAYNWTPEPWIASARGVWVETFAGEGGPEPAPPEGEQIGDFSLPEDAARATQCVNAFAGIEDPTEALRMAREALAPMVALLDRVESGETQGAAGTYSGGELSRVHVPASDLRSAREALAALGVER